MDDSYGSKWVGFVICCKVYLSLLRKDFRLSLVGSLFCNSKLCVIYNILTGISGKEVK